MSTDLKPDFASILAHLAPANIGPNTTFMGDLASPGALRIWKRPPSILAYAPLLFRATVWHRDEYPTIKAQPQSRTLLRFWLSLRCLSSKAFEISDLGVNWRLGLDEISGTRFHCSLRTSGCENNARHHSSLQFGFASTREHLCGRFFSNQFKPIAAFLSGVRLSSLLGSLALSELAARANPP